LVTAQLIEGVWAGKRDSRATGSRGVGLEGGAALVGTIWVEHGTLIKRAQGRGGFMCAKKVLPFSLSLRESDE